MSLRLIGLLVLLLSYSGCLSYTHMQSAKTVNPGQGSTMVAASMYESPSIPKELNPNTPYDKTPVRDYTLILGHRRGLTRKSDFGFQVSLIGTTKMDYKYMFYRTQEFAASAGFALGYSSLQIGSGSNEVQVQIMDYIFPLYTSYDFGIMTTYFIPQLLIRDISGDIGGGQSLFGYTFGLIGGDEYRMAIEFTQMQSGIQNIGFGYYF